MSFQIFRLRDLDFEENQISVIRKGGKLDTIAVVPESMQDLKEYLLIRSDRYKAGKEDYDYVFVRKLHNVASPLSNRTIESLVKKYTRLLNQINLCPHIS